MEEVWSMSSLPNNEFSEFIFEKDSHGLLHCHKQLFGKFWDQWWVLQSFTKYFETNK